MLTLKQLNYALAVEKTLHFKKAAEVCNVSQSALSTAINELERQLGVMIFERNNKQVLVTDEGLPILAKAKQIKIEVDELMQLTRANKAPLSQPMTFGVIPTIGPYLLPKVLPEIRKQHPDFKLKIVEDQSHVLVDKLRSGEIDAAILAMPYAIDGLMRFDFWQEDFYWITHKDEGSDTQQEISSDELEVEKLMLLKDGHCLKDHALAACSLQSRQQNSDFDSTSLYTLIQMVAGRLGTTLVPQMALAPLINNQSELRAVHLNEPGPHRVISLVIRPNYVRANEITLIKRLFTDTLNA
jgi:LysR family hydrogen peroxide-inducible transcriptional activator